MRREARDGQPFGQGRPPPQAHGEFASERRDGAVDLPRIPLVAVETQIVFRHLPERFGQRVLVHAQLRIVPHEEVARIPQRDGQDEPLAAREDQVVLHQHPSRHGGLRHERQGKDRQTEHLIHGRALPSASRAPR